MPDGKAESSKILGPNDQLLRHVKPLGARVLVRLDSGDDRSSGGLYLPPGAKEALAQAAYGVVIEVARAEGDESEGFGQNVSGVPEGVKVIFPKEEGLPVPWDEALRIVDVKAICAVVEEIEPNEVH